MAAGGGLEQKRRFDLVVGEEQADALLLADVEPDDRSRRLGPAEERAYQPAGLSPGDELPARARREPSAVRPDRVHARPPVGEVQRLGQEAPDVRRGREQLARCDYARHLGQASPRRSRIRSDRRPMKCRSPGEARIATTTAASPAEAKAISG